MGDSIVRKTDRALNKGERCGGLLSRGKHLGYHREDGKKCGSRQGSFYFSTRRD